MPDMKECVKNVLLEVSEIGLRSDEVASIETLLCDTALHCCVTCNFQATLKFLCIYLDILYRILFSIRLEILALQRNYLKDQMNCGNVAK